VSVRRILPDDLSDRLDELRAALVDVAAGEDRLLATHPDNRASAENLAHYVALRRRDIRDLQADLSALGLSSLGRSEAHVLASLDAVRAAVAGLSGRPRPESHTDPCPRERVTLIVRDCLYDLAGSPPGAMPELTERLARQRLLDTPPLADLRQSP